MESTEINKQGEVWTNGAANGRQKAIVPCTSIPDCNITQYTSKHYRRLDMLDDAMLDQLLKVT